MKTFADVEVLLYFKVSIDMKTQHPKPQKIVI